ncbi:MAG: hypothetical protein JKY46_00515 [Robiginitomaculum sp.]|nr:hypothetical protein [Robiginitomaculum sp.]
MRFHLIAIIVFMLATLMGGSASFAEASDNNEVQKNLLIGSWYMPEPMEMTEAGIAISFTNMNVTYSSNGTSAGSSSMNFISGDGVDGVRQNDISLTYHLRQ